jgi:hypothetical protein
MTQTTIIVREDDDGKTHILLEKGAAQGSRNDQKIAVQLVNIANKMLNPQTMSQVKQLANNPVIKNLLNR